MSADGSHVYFVTKDQLVGGDTDTSADLYRADVGGASATLTQVSTGTGGGGDTDPAARSLTSKAPPGTTWKARRHCDVVAFAGGAGVAAGDGAAYFLSPEKLDGHGHPGPAEPVRLSARAGRCAMSPRSRRTHRRSTTA